MLLKVVLVYLFWFLRFYLFIFRERGREGDREEKKHQCVVASHTHPLLGTWPKTQACALSGNLMGDPLVHRSVLNPLSHTSQGVYLSLSLILELLY